MGLIHFMSALTVTLGAEIDLGNRGDDPLSMILSGNKGIARCCLVTRLIRLDTRGSPFQPPPAARRPCRER